MQNTRQKTKDWATPTPPINLKTGIKSGAPEG